MLRQYLELKDLAGDALLFYRMGDFYEMFFEDAQKAAPILGIALTRRRHNDNVEAPMCGIPYHAFDNYLGKLLAAGLRVAVAEQVEDPATAKGLVRREIIRTHTPGTISDTDLLEGTERCFLAAFSDADDGAAIAWLEISTGTFEGMMCPDLHALTEQLGRLRPREILIAEGRNDWQDLWPRELPHPTVTGTSAEAFSPSAGEARMRRILGVSSVRGYGLEPGERLLGVAGALLAYLENTQIGKSGKNGQLAHLGGFIRHEIGDSLIIDRGSLRNLEVEANAQGGRRGSLMSVLDRCQTRMGSRQLRDWILRPSLDLDRIEARHAGVGEFTDNPRLLTECRNGLKNLPDLERLAARIGLGMATPKELETLRAGIDRLPSIKAQIDHASSPLLREIANQLDPLPDLNHILHERLAAIPAAVVGKGVIREGWDEKLDEQRTLASGGKEILSSIEAAERERTGISKLKIKYNKVFGYFIEISNSYRDRIPENYERRQTLTNAERYIIPELKELESRILSAEEKAIARERELYDELIHHLSSHARRVAETALLIAQLDVLACFADRARLMNYCRPHMEDDTRLLIDSGRHPVIEELQRDPPFVPNDCELQPDENQIILLTGPNMGGKSTYLRQVALITLMAHAGSFVPATDATIGITDRIFTRVGASDMLAKGESTFMVEMTETANILRHATPRSLVILDEVGRGTATFDGLSLAWSIVEYLHDLPEHAAKVLFATHYHELTDLARMLPRLVNKSMAVKEWRGSILFLHRISDGPSDRSYGIHVARLAGVPQLVCDRAEEVLKNLEKHEINVTGDPVMAASSSGSGNRILQMELFRPPTEEIAERLRALDIDTMTPIDALNFLADIKDKITDEK